MGRLTYDVNLNADFDDRVLAHLQLVIGAKLRRGESFYFGWIDDPAIGVGRTTVWLHPAVSMVFKYYGSHLPAINRKWLEVLTASADSAGGLRIVPEPEFAMPTLKRK